MSDDRPSEPGEQPHVHVEPLTDAAVSALCVLARSLGFACFRIDLDGCVDKGEFLDRIAGGLGFPAWFGRNWDALFDCISDMAWHPAPGYVLVLENAAALQRIQPEVFDTALAILSDAGIAWQERGIPFRVFASTPAEGGATP